MFPVSRRTISWSGFPPTRQRQTVTPTLGLGNVQFSQSRFQTIELSSELGMPIGQIRRRGGYYAPLFVQTYNPKDRRTARRVRMTRDSPCGLRGNRPGGLQLYPRILHS